jgi:hypothetical protein
LGEFDDLSESRPFLRSFGAAGHAGIRYNVDKPISLGFGEASDRAILDFQSMPIRSLLFRRDPDVASGVGCYRLSLYLSVRYSLLYESDPVATVHVAAVQILLRIVRSSDCERGREASSIPSHQLISDRLPQLLFRLARQPLLVIPENRIEDRADHCRPANGTSSISADVDRYLVEIRDLVIGKQDADLGRRCRVVFGHTSQSAREFRTRYIPECPMAIRMKKLPLSSSASLARSLCARDSTNRVSAM